MPRFLFTEKLPLNKTYQGEAITPSDSNNLPSGPCDAIYVATAGNVSIVINGGGTAILTGLSVGQIVRVQAARINATGTTATGISALYL
jgi:hypothetical protein